VEVVETSTRRMLVAKAVEQAEETSCKVEESLTEQKRRRRGEVRTAPTTPNSASA
jgi:hypothetical protein